MKICLSGWACIKVSDQLYSSLRMNDERLGLGNCTKWFFFKLFCYKHCLAHEQVITSSVL